MGISYAQPSFEKTVRRIYRLTPLPPTSQLDDWTISRLVYSKHPRVQYVDCVDLRDCRIFACVGGGDVDTELCEAWRPTAATLEYSKHPRVQYAKSPICGLCGFARLSHILTG